jgi:DNA-binding IclR family transcriptional regulator
LHATAFGKVLLAYDASLPRTGKLTSLTRRTIVSPQALERVLTQVRANGWASEAEECLPGEAGIAAPIRAPGGLVVGAIGVSGAVERICDSASRPKPALVSQVCGTAEAVSRALSD